ncbi:MAG: dual specificity protein phosphatase [Marmoricola sp.]
MTNSKFAEANANFVTPYLAIGGDLSYDDQRAIEQSLDVEECGITHLLDVRCEDDDSTWWAHFPGLEYLWAGIDDDGQTVPAEWFESITSWAVDAICEGGKVLTYCHMGINRGPSAGFAVLLRMGWEPVEALAAIRQARPIAAISYAEDALAWHFARIGATARQKSETLRAVAAWREANPIDVVRIIRKIRRDEHEVFKAWRSQNKE